MKSNSIPQWINDVSNKIGLNPETYISLLKNKKIYKYKYIKTIAGIKVTFAHISSDPQKIQEKLPIIINSLKEKIHCPFTLKISVEFHEIIVVFKNNEDNLFEFWNWSHEEKYDLLKNNFLGKWSITNDEQTVFPQI